MESMSADCLHIACQVPAQVIAGLPYTGSWWSPAMLQTGCCRASHLVGDLPRPNWKDPAVSKWFEEQSQSLREMFKGSEWECPVGKHLEVNS